MENIEFGFGGFFRNFKVGDKYHMVGMYGSDYYVAGCGDYDERMLKNIFRVNIYEVVYKDDERLILETSWFKDHGFQSANDDLPKFVLNLISGEFINYGLNNSECDFFTMRQAVRYEVNSESLIWLSTDEELTEFDDYSLKNLHKAFYEGILIVPFGNLEFEDL